MSDEFIFCRISEILDNNEEYKSLETENVDIESIRALAEKLCYLNGLIDGIELARKCSQKM